MKWAVFGLSTVQLMAVAGVFLIVPGAARPETAEEWVALGTRIHGGFGTFIPVGIRIGEDALQRLGVSRRDVSVVYSSGPAAPCPCIADGIAIATQASVGQGTLQLTPDKSPPDTLGEAVIRDRKSGRTVHYKIPASLLPQLIQWNKDRDALGRFNAVMDAPAPFQVIEDGNSSTP